MKVFCNSCGEQVVVNGGTRKLSTGLKVGYGMCKGCKGRKKIFVEVLDNHNTMNQYKRDAIEIETI